MGLLERTKERMLGRFVDREKITKKNSRGRGIMFTSHHNRAVVNRSMEGLRVVAAQKTELGQQEEKSGPLATDCPLSLPCS